MKRAILIQTEKLANELHPVLPLADYQTIAKTDNGIEALRMAQRLAPDLIFCGWNITGISALDLVQNLVDSKICPIILTLEEKNYNYLHLAVKTNVHHIVTTPIRAMDIMSGITQAEHRYQAELQRNKEIRKLQEEMKTRKVLYQAIFKLISSGLNEETAYSAIRTQAMTSRKTMGAVALEVIQGTWRPHA